MGLGFNLVLTFGREPFFCVCLGALLRSLWVILGALLRSLCTLGCIAALAVRVGEGI